LEVCFLEVDGSSLVGGWSWLVETESNPDSQALLIPGISAWKMGGKHFRFF
jgi:hypothetical protein